MFIRCLRFGLLKRHSHSFKNNLWMLDFLSKIGKQCLDFFINIHIENDNYASLTQLRLRNKKPNCLPFVYLLSPIKYDQDLGIYEINLNKNI